MHHFVRKEGHLFAEDVDLAELARAIGTPAYVYSTATLERHYKVFDAALDGLDRMICFALKANANQGVIATLARLGAGADVVSEGEMCRALAAGIPPGRIVFSGVGKTDAEIAAALDAGIYEINVESAGELEQIIRSGRNASIAFRINPDVDARTHAKISTGKGENKFGIAIDQIPDLARIAREAPNVELKGLALHIGSQLTDLAPLEAAFGKLIALCRALRTAGHGITRLDFGGGLGIPYKGETPPLPDAYGALVRRMTADLDVTCLFEPGRLITGNAGILLTRVIGVKQGASRRFLILDCGMNDLLRPALYDAWHEIVPVGPPRSGRELAHDVVGPVCETGDTFAQDRLLPPLEAGDLVAIMSVGAYGSVMSSTYNSRPLVPEVLVKGGEFALVRERQTIAELIARDTMPNWLQRNPEKCEAVFR